MKNKALTYVLLIVVALIWYQVFFRVKNNLLGEDEILVPNRSGHVALNPVQRDTFLLKANYRDPFGEGKKRGELPQIENNAPQVNVRRNSAPPKTQWPPMEYFGLVRKTDSKTPLAIFKIDGLQMMVRKGDELYNAIYVNQIWRDSIQLRWGKERKTVSR